MKIFGKIVAVIVVLFLAYFAWWRYDFADRENRVTPEALAALESDDIVAITEYDWIVFEPLKREASKGLIFYPGGEVDERGYAQPLRQIAAAGYLVVVTPMPFQLAVFDVSAADAVIAAYPEIDTWAIGGHSLGGAMASSYTLSHPDTIDGLILWDAYSASDLSAGNQAVRMVHRADKDGNLPEDYLEFLPNHPEQTEYIPIIGGNHLNFGNFIAGRLYRDEPEPALEGDVQRAQVAVATIEFMNSL
ncbi:MAG: alpha/beta hydrolase [Gammaproteobacteria bacterium]